MFSSLNQKRFSGNKLLHLAIFTMNLFLQCRRSSRQSRERLVVHGNDRLAMEQELSLISKCDEYVIQSIRSFPGSHRVMISNAEETHIGSEQIVDHLHIAKHGSVSTVIDVVVCRLARRRYTNCPACGSRNQRPHLHRRFHEDSG